MREAGDSIVYRGLYFRTDQQKQPGSPHVGAHVSSQVLDYVDAQFRPLYILDDIIDYVDVLSSGAITSETTALIMLMFQHLAPVF